MSDSLEHLRTDTAASILQLIETSPDLSNEELRAILCNALSRIAELENCWNSVASALQKFDEQYPGRTQKCEPSG
jgi:hypothetical protein